MARAPHTHEHIASHVAQFGHPSDPIKPARRAELERLGTPLPQLTLGLITPPVPGARAGSGGCCDQTPHEGHCHVCGAPTRKDQHLRAHATAGFEDAIHPAGGRLRLLVTHCDEHARGSDHCSRDNLTPGSGILDGPGGYCEALGETTELACELFPGARSVGKFLKFAVAGGGLWLMTQLAIQTSRGQMIATLQGTTNAQIAAQDSTNAHGYNNGNVKIYSGTAPALGDTAESGTLLINWVLTASAQAFGAASAATPTVTTAAAIANVNASASNTAGYGRLLASGDTGVLSTTERRIQFSVAAPSGGDMNFNTLVISSGGACSVTAFTITHGA